MEAQTDIQSYMERGKQALAEGQPRDAAIAYAHAAQLDPDNAAVHLGLAKANMGLNSYRVVHMACDRVQELQPQGGLESQMARILLTVLDRRYDRALLDIDTYITQDPANGYAHALRGYLLQASGQAYDAGLARARASRLTYGGRFEHCFPPLEPSAATSDNAATAPSGQVASAPAPAWTPPNTIQRQAVRARFMASQHPRLVTNILIAINVVVFLITAYLSKSISDISQDVLVTAGGQYNVLVQQGQFWRIFTAMFLHSGILHVGLNMLSLFFVGTAIEMFYGKWRYLVIYLLSGIAGGIATLVLYPPETLAVGASGAIFGVFGALGAFYIVNRRSLGAYGQGAIFNWLFWLALNLVWSFSIPNIAIYDHIGGLAVGLILGLVLVRRLRPRRVA